MVNSLVVNGAAAQIANGGVVLTGWAAANNVGAEIAIVDLVEGENTITFTMANLNINIAGVEIHAFADITHEPTKIFHGGKLADVNPLTKNGSKDNELINHATNGIYYQNNQNATFTFTVTVEEDMEATLLMDFTSTNNKAYAVNTIISSVSVNGTAASINTGSITTKGWNVANDVKATIATFSLKAGTNTITIVFGGNNLNVSSVYLHANGAVTFGKE